MIWENTKDSRIKKRSGIYWARFMKSGKRVELSLETKNFELAKRLVSDIEGKLLVGRNWRKERELFQDAWIEFLRDKKSGNRVKPARDKTLREYAGFGVRYFLPFFGEKRLSEIDSILWDDFIEWVKKDRPDVLFFNIRKYMSGFLTWAKRHEKILAPPYLRDPDASRNKDNEDWSPGKAYTKEELERLRAVSKAHGRFHLWMLMAQYMGMRPGEINQLNRDRVDLESGMITLKRIDTKTGDSRRIPIHPLVLVPLAERMLATRGLAYLFPNRNDKTRPMDPQGFKKVWYEIAQTANVDGRMYDFRHTFITHAIAQGLNPAAVAKLTGTSLRMIEKFYLHLSNDDLKTTLGAFRL